ncbi:gamma subclass chorismate mutase AroQ [Streptomyces sp. NBC_00887]|uniref:gamma subclass chorismate mutase AroQ n=1 Tax=Streptomyces sp. NBC_00887 TaxID=2975859 RepID=UPI00386E24D8|nr:gamma subclass chorismate mutase AroQ [Streptomyces sp. NBC_00887]
MQPTAYARRLLFAGAVAAAVCAGPAAAAPAAPGADARHGGDALARLRPLVDLSARRLATAGLVAAAKWGTGRPVDDPVREGQVLDTAAGQAREAGADPGATVRIFRDQIEANKLVQRALHRSWDENPADAPTDRPDLAEVREEINRVDVGLVRAIAGSAAARAAPSCGGTLRAAQASVRRDPHVDRLRTAAMTYALRSVCARPSPARPDRPPATVGSAGREVSVCAPLVPGPGGRRC